MPTARSRPTACSRAVDLVAAPWARIISVICVSTRTTGLSAVAGSWKIMAISRPRMAPQSPFIEPQQVLAAVLDRSGNDLPWSRHQPDQRTDRRRLPGAALSDQTKDLSGIDAKRNVVNGSQRTPLGWETRGQASHDEQRLVRYAILSCRDVKGVHFGRKRSATPSPRRLSPIPVKTMASPGNVTIHHCWARYVFPSVIICPHSGSGGCTPRPRNDSAVADRMQRTISDMAKVIVGVMTLGRAWRKIWRPGRKPRARAASMYSSFRTTRISPRISRV